MRLYLSNNPPWNSVYTNEAGKVLYKVKTPMSLSARTSTITRVVPSNNRAEDLRVKFEVLAQIDHNVGIKPAVLRFEGNEVEAESLFRKGGVGPLGRDRVFTAPNGKECKWHLGTFTSSLVATDKAKTPIAKFHRPFLGIKSHGSLEIFPAGKDFVSMVVITFIYVEKLRKERERQATSIRV